MLAFNFHVSWMVTLSCLPYHFYFIFLAETQNQSKKFLATKGMMAVLVLGVAVIMVLLVSSFLFIRMKMKGNQTYIFMVHFKLSIQCLCLGHRLT